MRLQHILNSNCLTVGLDTIFILYVLLKKFGYCFANSIFAPYSSQV
jgi:hypothetical protein